MSSFEGKSMQTQYNVLGYRIDLYFLDYKLAMQIDENCRSDRILKIQKAIEHKTWL